MTFLRTHSGEKANHSSHFTTSAIKCCKDRSATDADEINLAAEIFPFKNPKYLSGERLSFYVALQMS